MHRVNALPLGRAFLHISMEKSSCGSQLYKIWMLLVDKDIKKKAYVQRLVLVWSLLQK